MYGHFLNMQFERIYVGLTVKLLFLKKFLFIVLFLTCLFRASAQSSFNAAIINTDSLTSIKQLEKPILLFIDSSGKKSLSGVEEAAFFPLQQFARKDKIPSKIVSSAFYLRFKLLNNSTYARSFYIYPGRLYQQLNLYSSTNGGVFTEQPIPTASSGFALIKINPNQTVEYILKAHFFKSYTNQLSFYLIHPNHFNLFKDQIFGTQDYRKTVGLIFSGMLIMMMLITLLNYIITKKTEFLYNTLYSFCMSSVIFFTAYFFKNSSWLKGFYTSYLEFLLMMSGMVFYLIFTKKFLNAREKYPKLDRFLKTVCWMIAGIIIMYTFLHFGVNNYAFEINFVNTVKIFLLLSGLVFIVYACMVKDRLMNYLAIGASLQIMFSGISLILGIKGAVVTSIFYSSFFYYQLGVIASVIFFLLGLFYKNRQELILKIKEQEALKLDAEKQTYKSELTVYKAQQEERNRISADMHDDLGAGMTSIRLYSELAKSKAGDNIIPEIEKISSSADELINNMNAIIWSMSSQNDSLGNMVAYIRSYTTEYLDSTGIKPIINIPERLPEFIVNGTIRRNIFLVMKEALQNIVKHSNATEVRIALNKEPEGLSLTIHDNGKGIDFNNLRQFSNGLKNMKKRMTDIEVDFSIENNNGTLIRLYRKTR